MVWLKELRIQSDGSDEFSVELEKGKDYTLEFSKNFTELLDAILPEIRIYDPDNAKLAEIEAETLPGVKITLYPEESPSLICYTFKAPVSGSYLIRVRDANPTTLDVDEEEAEANPDEYSEVDTASVIFLYEEIQRRWRKRLLHSFQIR